MAEEKQQTNQAAPVVEEKKTDGKFDNKRNFKGGRGPRKPGRDFKGDDEFEQKIIDIARVTRVMAGGKRMRFRACVAVGNKKGKIGLGLAKGADVTMAVNKAVTRAKKEMIEVPIVKNTIPHEIREKFSAARIMLKPAAIGRGVIAGGIVRMIIELAGIHNITSKILGGNNKVNNAKCVMSALSKLKKIKPNNSENIKKAELKIENSKIEN